jgi:hypothetical protein
MTGIRITIGLIIAAIVAVALIPMLVLLDLAGGGDGWGLCEGGIAACSTSYFDGPELLAMLLIALFLLLMLLRVTLHARRMMLSRQDRRDTRTLGASADLGGRPGPPDR